MGKLAASDSGDGGGLTSAGPRYSTVDPQAERHRSASPRRNCLAAADMETKYRRLAGEWL